MLASIANAARPYLILFFPEGTDLNPRSEVKSREYAAANGLPQYHHTLHPRTTGFVHVVQTLRHQPPAASLEVVYDVIIAFEGTIPQNEGYIVRAELPRAVHLLVREYRAESLPADEAGLAAWLTHRFEEKERVLARFYRGGSNDGSIAAEGGHDPLVTAALAERIDGMVGDKGQWRQPPYRCDILDVPSIALTLSLLVCYGYLAVTRPWQLATYAVVHAVVNVGVLRLFGGLDAVELALAPPTPALAHG